MALKTPQDYADDDETMSRYVNLLKPTPNPIVDARRCCNCKDQHKYVVGGSMGGQIWRCLNCGSVNRTR